MPIQAAIPKPTSGLISPELKGAYRSVIRELAKGAEDPYRDIKLKSGEGIPTALARFLKLRVLDYPEEFLTRGGRAVEDPLSFTSSEFLSLAADIVSMGVPGGRGAAGIRKRIPIAKEHPIYLGLEERLEKETPVRKALRLLELPET